MGKVDLHAAAGLAVLQGLILDVGVSGLTVDLTHSLVILRNRRSGF